MRVVISLVLCVAATAFADIPQTKARRPALERYAAAEAKLDADYQARLAALNRQLANDLQAAIKQATRNGDLEDANALKAYLERLAANRPASPANPFAGTAWRHNGGGDLVTYTSSEASATSWTETMRYRVVSSRSIIQSEPDGSEVIVTLEDGGRYAFWRYSNGQIAYAVRVDR